MTNDFIFAINSIDFDENYHPSDNTRATTNFANLARGASRQQNLRNTLMMINNRFNALAHWDNPKSNRYSVELDIISVDMKINHQGTESSFPAIEVLQTTIVDHLNNKRIEGILGNNFSSYVRDYDFSVRLKEHNKGQTKFSVPSDFGELHANIFKSFVNSDAYQKNFTKLPVICLSVSDNKIYHRTGNEHPILGVEYQPNESSLTEQYFKKMGLAVRYFMPPNSVAPLAFHFFGDLLSDYTELELISTISTMESFQKIYRPEIYNANAVAGEYYQPSLQNPDHSLTQVFYDREERNKLALEQGKFTEENFIKPYQGLLEQWSAKHAA
ncbi:DUF1852 domain-containing protein [Denitrificimonas sp. JX-1]|uniref:DUF1852 domain-containing protein n=1 Tax=Denitrificimonas halotolerans TaxID=3098930 RepID=A0ABU5GTX9_9GAMM|nr:DUF1852 domain-containing protein [Denitrificimonas sp. JX-1]MDY7220428.1 DUF1852 domain-containing protein [Denitrificimonas sp. JX-1]